MSNKRDPEHSDKVDRFFLEAGHDSSTFFGPTDEPFYDVALSVVFFIEGDASHLSILILLGRDNGFKAELNKVGIDPVRPVGFIASQFPCQSGRGAAGLRQIDRL